MIDERKHADKQAQREKARRRMHASIDPENYEYYPERKLADFYDNDIPQRVATYVRVSTDDVRQTTSFELQRRYYEEFVVRHPKWTLVGIYSDEGISGTSLKHRDAFNRMIEDCKAGKIDMIICKSVSRFARNVEDCVSTVRKLAALKKPVGVFFESECIFSLNEENSMGFNFLAAMAEEESHTRSRSMETSLRMRLDHGIPLTPKLLGYTHDADGNLIINPEEAPTVKLAFYMYLYGYSTQQIADAFTALKKKSYLGNVDKWTANSIVQILRNERHCGDVLTRKTFTPNFRNHYSRKNRGERPQSRYKNHHEAIVTRDDFIAVQRLLDSSRFRHNTYLPELRVIDSGVLKGFVVIHPSWAGFGPGEYMQASHSAYADEDRDAEGADGPQEYQIVAQAGDFDLRGFVIARAELFDHVRAPHVTFADRKIKFNMTCIQKFGDKNRVELLVHPFEKWFALRPAPKESKNTFLLSKLSGGKHVPRDISIAAFSDTLFKLFGWNRDRQYRIIGSLYEQGDELAYIFDSRDSLVTLQPHDVHTDEGELLQPLVQTRSNGIPAMPAEWATTFGKDFYLHERSLSALANQSEEDWNLLLEGQLIEMGHRLEVTPFEELRSFIQSQLGDIIQPKEGEVDA